MPPGGQNIFLTTADTVLACADFDAAKAKHPDLMAQALKEGPSEQVFRSHWQATAKHHYGLRKLFLRLCLPTPDSILSCKGFEDAQSIFPALMRQAVEEGPAEAVFRANWAPTSKHHAGLRKLFVRICPVAPAGSAAPAAAAPTAVWSPAPPSAAPQADFPEKDVDEPKPSGQESKLQKILRAAAGAAAAPGAARGGFGTPAAQQAAAAAGQDFIAVTGAHKHGAPHFVAVSRDHPGYVFRKGPKGIGYYKDVQIAVAGLKSGDKKRGDEQAWMVRVDGMPEGKDPTMFANAMKGLVRSFEDCEATDAVGDMNGCNLSFPSQDMASKVVEHFEWNKDAVTSSWRLKHFGVTIYDLQFSLAEKAAETWLTPERIEEHGFFNAFGALDVPYDASAEEITKAYRKISFKFHPDRAKGRVGAQEWFQVLGKARDILEDEKKRRVLNREVEAAMFRLGRTVVHSRIPQRDPENPQPMPQPGGLFYEEDAEDEAAEPAPEEPGPKRYRTAEEEWLAEMEERAAARRGDAKDGAPAGPGNIAC